MGEAPAGWDESALADPHGDPQKASRVRSMFDRIAPSYDLNNRLHSLGRDQAWRRRTVRAASVSEGETVVDVACGTGDLAVAFDATPARRIVGLDFAPRMLALARAKARRAGARVDLARSDAMRLPLATGSADVVTIAFGIRNVADPAAAIAELHRVLAPGGRLLILEFGTPRQPMLRRLYSFYFHQVLPRTATWIARDKSGAYRYLPKSVDAFLDARRLRAMMRDAGFAEPDATPLTFGIAMLYRAVKPASG